MRRLADKGISNGFESLSEREREIFSSSRGPRQQEIAELLSSARPRSKPTAAMSPEANLHSTAELVLYAVRRGVVD